MLLADPAWRESRQADGFFARPELDEGLSFYLQAWMDLAGDRRESLAPIPFSSIALYAERVDMAEGETFERFRGYVRALDAEYLDITNRKLTREMRRGKS
jgi:hypothetical protein